MQHDYKARKQGLPIMPLDERLLSKTIKNHTTGCWEWQGSNRNVIKVGEEHPRSKLTKKLVIDARRERANKGTSFQKLAERYGVSKKTIQNAIKGVTWKCVPYMPEPPKGEN